MAADGLRAHRRRHRWLLGCLRRRHGRLVVRGQPTSRPRHGPFRRDGGQRTGARGRRTNVAQRPRELGPGGAAIAQASRSQPHFGVHGGQPAVRRDWRRGGVQRARAHQANHQTECRDRRCERNAGRQPFRLAGVDDVGALVAVVAVRPSANHRVLRVGGLAAFAARGGERERARDAASRPRTRRRHLHFGGQPLSASGR